MVGYSEEDLADDFDNEIQRKPSSSGGSSSGGRNRRQLLLPRSDDSDDDDTATSGKRKRSRPTLYQKRYGDADDSTVPTRKTQRLVIGDTTSVEQLYLHRFMDMQQSSCKVMAKAFVKLVEPKKQSNHPYTKGNIKAPPWWPNTEGENHVTHKEPDHLKKPGRLTPKSSIYTWPNMRTRTAQAPSPHLTHDHRATEQPVCHRPEARAECRKAGAGN